MLTTPGTIAPISTAMIHQIHRLAEFGFGAWHTGLVPDALLLARVLDVIDRVSPVPLGTATVGAVAEYVVERHAAACRDRPD